MAGFPATAWIWWTAGVIIGLLAIWLLYRSLLQDRSRGRRRCPKCWYDMSGTQSLTCSECGGTYKRERKLFKTRRRWRWAAVGSLLVLIALGLTGWPYASTVDSNTIKPVWLLLRDGELNTQKGLAARTELVRRLQGGRLSSRQLNRVIEHALDIQADPDAYWTGPQLTVDLINGSWGALIEKAWDQDRLSEEQLVRYLRTAFDTSFKVTPRATIRAGQKLPVRFETGMPRLSDRWDIFDRERSLVHVGELKAITVGETSIPFRSRVYSMGESDGGGMSTERPFSFDLPVGKHEVRFEWEFAVRSHERGAPTVHERSLEHSPADLARWTRTTVHTVEVADADQPVVSTVRDDAMYDAIRKAIRLHLTETSVQIGRSTFGGRHGMILFDPVPMDLGFDVFCRSGDVEKQFGAIVVPGGKNGIENAQRITIDPTTLFPDATSVDVIFRTSTTPAERTVGITSIWDGEIVFENVELKDPAPIDPIDATTDDR